jgi:hypothetical protein
LNHEYSPEFAPTTSLQEEAAENRELRCDLSQLWRAIMGIGEPISRTQPLGAGTARRPRNLQPETPLWGRSWSCGIVGMLSSLLLLACVGGAQARESASTAPDTATRAVLSQAALTRALAIENPGALSQQLTSFPQGLIAPVQRTTTEWRALWSFFFKGSMTKLALRPAHPHIIFLNPTADVAVIASCPKQESTGLPVCRHLCAIPGEALAGETAARRPSWTSAKSPIEALEVGAKARLQSFASRYDSTSAGTAPKLCTEQSQAIAEVRLLDLLLSTEGLRANEFSQALANYSLSRAKALPVSSREVPPADPTLAVLARIPGLSLSAALPLKEAGWLVFFTPKRNGWEQAVLVLQELPRSALELKSLLLVKY